MRGLWLSLLALAGVFALVGALAVDPVRGLDWVGILGFAGASLLVFPLHIVVHECGHLVAALLTGLRVTGVRLLSLRHQSAVVVEPTGPALPVRMTAFILAGPLANLALAALAWQLWRASLPTPVRLVAAFAAVTGVIFAAANLIPIRPSSPSLDPDGLNLLRWVSRPRLMSAATTNDRGRLDQTIDTTDHPLVLLVAVMRRRQIDSGYQQFVPMAERLNGIAHDERTKPAHAATIAAQLAVTFGTGYLRLGIVEGNAIDRANADELIEIAELGHRLRPRDEATRIGLAVARLLDHRPAEARALLTGLRATTPLTHGLSTQLFALAEIYLGHRERADALLATVRAGDPAMSEIHSALRSADALPALVQGSVVYSGGSQSSMPGPSTGSTASAASPSVGATAATAASDPVIATSSPEGSTPPRP